MSSFLVDSNVLIYASDIGAPKHSAAVKILEEAFESRETWCIAWQNIYEYLSVVTHPSGGSPLPLDDALENMEKILELGHVRIIQETEGHWQILEGIVKSVKARGVFLHDCHLAALLQENDVRRIVTADKGFRRFHFLDIHNPFLNQ